MNPSSPLSGLLEEAIRRNGPIPFSVFMDHCLHHPEHGYYAGGRKRVGREGDFYTSVSVGPMFGRILAWAFHGYWERLGRPDPFMLCEQGGEAGHLMADIAGTLARDYPDCARACRLRWIEPHPSLQTQQKESLAACGWTGGAEWITSPDECRANSFVGVWFSNELPDSFPVDLAVWRNGQWMEKRVGVTASSFHWTEVPLEDGAASTYLREQQVPPLDGFTVEIPLAALRWMKTVGRIMRRGFVVTIDYGHDRGTLFDLDRRDGTLRGYRQHRMVEDILAHPGETDLTTHVNFTALQEAGRAEGLETDLFTDQHHYLVETARPRLLEMERGGQTWSPGELRAFKTLMHPEMMGTSFKVLVQRKGVA
jgi:SAM-dependent MidA family methyltransferase